MLLNQIAPFHALTRDFDRLFEGFVPSVRMANKTRFPRVTIEQLDEGGYELRAEVPGVTAEDLDVTVHGNRVTLRGKQAEQTESKDKNFLVREWHESEFERAFDLPTDLDDKAVVAELKDGVLRLQLPLAADQKPQKIQVRSGS